VQADMTRNDGRRDVSLLAACLLLSSSAVRFDDTEVIPVTNIDVHIAWHLCRAWHEKIDMECIAQYCGWMWCKFLKNKIISSQIYVVSKETNKAVRLMVFADDAFFFVIREKQCTMADKPD